jgi:hypothetical protein
VQIEGGGSPQPGRQDLIDLGVRDRRFGYPLELLLRAGDAGWRVVEVDVAYLPRAAGTRSKVSGSVRGTARTIHDFAKVTTAVRAELSRKRSTAVTA